MIVRINAIGGLFSVPYSWLGLLPLAALQNMSPPSFVRMDDIGCLAEYEPTLTGKSG